MDNAPLSTRPPVRRTFPGAKAAFVSTRIVHSFLLAQDSGWLKALQISECCRC